jgi:hypothetical protein
MTRRQWGLAALGVVMLAWILGGEWVSIHAHVPENHFIDAVGGLSYLLAGLVALDRRPGNAFGKLMVAYVAVSYLGNWGNLQVAVVPMIGLIGQQPSGAIVAHAALSYPTGRLRTRFERVVIGIIYGVSVLVGIVIALAFDPRAAGCARCAWEPAPFPSRPAVLTALLVSQRLGAVLVLLFLAAVWLRWRRSTPAERRDLAPFWVAVCIVGLVYLAGAFASPDPAGDSFAYLVWELQSVLQISLPVVFLCGLLMTRLARSAVGDLVIELDRTLLPGELRATLARALGDPSLELLYALDGQERWVDPGGRPAPLPEKGRGQRARTVTVVERDGQPLAALIHDPALDQGLVRAAAAAAGMTIENERLQAEVRAQLEEVRASRLRILEAGGCRRPTPAKGFSPRSGSARDTRRSASSSCPSTSRRGRRSSCCRPRRSGSATCSRIGFPTSRNSLTPCGGSPGAGRRSTPRSWRTCCGAGEKAACSASSPAASGTSSP